MIVVDTNVLVALLLNTRETSTAVAVHTRDPDWAAPPLWRSELRKVLVQQIRAGHLELAAAQDIARFATDVIAHEQDVLSSQVLQLAVESGCSAYDCEFAALAQSLDTPLVTLDRALLREFPELAIAPGRFAAEK